MALVLAFSTVTPLATSLTAKAAPSPLEAEVLCEDQKAVLKVTARQALLPNVPQNEYNWDAVVGYTTPYGTTINTLTPDDTDTYTKSLGVTEIAAGNVSAHVIGKYTTKEPIWWFGTIIGYYHLAHVYNQILTANYAAKNCDSTLPTIIINTPAAAVLTNKNVPVNITATDNYKLNAVSVYAVDATNNVVDVCTSATNLDAYPQWVTSFTTDCVMNVTNLADGVYTLIARAQDRAGNFAVNATRTITVDKTVPTVTDMQQVYETKEDGRIAVTLTFSEPVVPATLGQGWYEVVGSNKTKFIKRYYKTKADTVTFQDNAGNEGTYAFTVDMTAPDAPVVSLRAGTTDLVNGGVTNSYSVKALWNTPAGSPVKYDYKYWNNIASSAHNTEAAAWINPVTANESDGVFNQGEGTHYIQVRAYDAVGNPSDWSDTFEIVYDATAPVVTLANYTTSGNVITPVITAADTNGPLTYAWTGSNPNVTLSANNVAEPTFTVSADGTYEYTLTVTDAAGNTTTKTFTFTYAAPVVNPLAQPASALTQTNNAPTGTFSNVALTPAADAEDTPAVAGANTQDNDDDNAEILGTTATPEKTDGGFSVLGLAWYWWLPILAAGAGAAWWLFALMRRNGEE